MLQSLDEALSPITDGIMLVVPREVCGVPMAATRALIRRGVRDLHLVALPTSSLQADLLIGAGCVKTLETSAVSLGELGPAPRFTSAVLKGAIVMKDATCPALHAAPQAAEKGDGWRIPAGLPFDAAGFGIEDPADQEWFNRRMTDHPLAAFADPIALSGAWEKVPNKLYIRC